MKNKKSYRQALRQATIPDSGIDAEEFWAEFKARAAITPQIDATEAPRRLSAFRRYKLVAACIVILLTILVVNLPEKTAVASAPAISQVEEVDVYMECDSLLIIEDSENKGTVIWFDANSAEQQ